MKSDIAGNDIIGKDDYYLKVAGAVAQRANCLGDFKVGAVMVKSDRVLATGYNGTAVGMPNCLDGGCKRCSDRAKFKSGTAYDLCSCVHAEANAIATAARFGIALEGATLYCTHRPCFSCSKELIQAGIVKVYYIDLWPKNGEVQDEVRDDYLRLQGQLSSEQRNPDESPPGKDGNGASTVIVQVQQGG